MRSAVLGLLLALPLAGCLGSKEGAPRAATPARPPACEPTPGGNERVDLVAVPRPSLIRLSPGMALHPTPRARAGARRGDFLRIGGVVRSADCRPLAGATVRAWQTNGRGRYGPGEGERMRCCYLQGELQTNREGRYGIETVVPRGYAGGPAHMHMEVGHPSAADGLLTELIFDDAAGPDATVVALEPAEDGAFTGTFDVVLPPGD